ncbi:MAG: Fic family protein [Spirochaetes bacterium]|nr:Fic family protein [Spirochaetota bacterium]
MSDVAKAEKILPGTLNRFLDTIDSIPASAAWYLADLGEAKGMQELYSRQFPQALKSLKKFAIIESAISSNRIEGVEIDKDRVLPLLAGNARVSDRDEEEVQGYKKALDRIFSGFLGAQVAVDSIRTLHSLLRGDVWDSGKYKDRDSDIIETYPDGRARLRFRTVPAAETPEAMARLVAEYGRCMKESVAHPLILIAAFNLDFLCIHPFRDGNGRASRLLLLGMLLSQGYEAGRYISIERLIEENKERYYETLELSSKGWHEGRHDPWPYINYLLFILKAAYKELASRAAMIHPERGEKHARILEAFKSLPDSFTLADLISQCPGISPETIRKAIKDLKREGKVEIIKAGRGALWRKLGK